MVLVEKLNIHNLVKKKMTKKEAAMACNRKIQESWKKDFTLEFSRDRKSMSCYCTLTTNHTTFEGKSFVKVNVCSVFLSQPLTDCFVTLTITIENC